MEFPIRVLVVVVLCMVAALIIMLLIFGFSVDTENLMGSFFDFFRNLLGFGG